MTMITKGVEKQDHFMDSRRRSNYSREFMQTAVSLITLVLKHHVQLRNNCIVRKAQQCLRKYMLYAQQQALSYNCHANSRSQCVRPYYHKELALQLKVWGCFPCNLDVIGSRKLKQIKCLLRDLQRKQNSLKLMIKQPKALLTENKIRTWQTHSTSDWWNCHGTGQHSHYSNANRITGSVCNWAHTYITTFYDEQWGRRVFSGVHIVRTLGVEVTDLCRRYHEYVTLSRMSPYSGRGGITEADRQTTVRARSAKTISLTMNLLDTPPSQKAQYSRWNVLLCLQHHTGSRPPKESGRGKCPWICGWKWLRSSTEERRKQYHYWATT